MPARAIPNEGRWILGYPIASDRRGFYKISSNVPVTVMGLDEAEFDKAKRGGSFMAFAGGTGLISQMENFIVPLSVTGSKVIFVIENLSGSEARVQFDSGGYGK